MRPYCIEYTLAGDSTIHTAKIYAPSAKDALTKLADRFGTKLKYIINYLHCTTGFGYRITGKMAQKRRFR